MTTRGRKPGHPLRATCKACGKKALAMSAVGFVCDACRPFTDEAIATIIGRAVALGELRRADEFACVDCGAPAHDYDHRDYNKPLDVVPVCRRCNLLRGPAIPKVGVMTRIVQRGDVPYRLRCRTVQLLERMGLPSDVLKGAPKRLDLSHWQTLLPLIEAAEKATA